MKTTIDISDDLALQAKELAKREGTTLRAVIEQGLRLKLEQAHCALSLIVCRTRVSRGEVCKPSFGANPGRKSGRPPTSTPDIDRSRHQHSRLRAPAIYGMARCGDGGDTTACGRSCLLGSSMALRSRIHRYRDPPAYLRPAIDGSTSDRPGRRLAGLAESRTAGRSAGALGVVETESH